MRFRRCHRSRVGASLYGYRCSTYVTYVCVCVGCKCMYIYIYLNLSIYLYKCRYKIYTRCIQSVYAFAHNPYMHSHTHMHMHIHSTQKNTHTHTRSLSLTHTHIHTHAYTCTLIYLYTCTYTNADYMHLHYTQKSIKSISKIHTLQIVDAVYVHVDTHLKRSNVVTDARNAPRQSKP